MSQTDVPPYRRADLPVDARVRDLLSRMTLEEKFWQLFMIPGDLDNPANDYSHGIFGLQIGTGRADAPDTNAAPTRSAADAARAHAERINAIQRYFVDKTRLGIPIIPFEEAVHGLTREGATMFPAAIGLAASWDTSLVIRVAGAIAAETRSRGIRQVLSPVINIADDVRWGRVEETYGEDPYLSAIMAQAYVLNFERAGVVTTPKHFIANVGEGGRDSYPVDHSARELTERYFPPFVAALAAGARSVMAAYNSVDGLPAHQNRWLLTDILKRDWAFTGFVISDASGTSGATVLHMTEASTATAAQHAFDAGLDVVFQSSYGQQRPYLDAVAARLDSDRGRGRGGRASAAREVRARPVRAARTSMRSRPPPSTDPLRIEPWRARPPASRSCCSRTTPACCRWPRRRRRLRSLEWMRRKRAWADTAGPAIRRSRSSTAFVAWPDRRRRFATRRARAA